MSANMKGPQHSEDIEEGCSDGGPRHAHRDRGPSIAGLDRDDILEDDEIFRLASRIDEPASSTRELFGIATGSGAVFVPPNVEK